MLRPWIVSLAVKESKLWFQVNYCCSYTVFPYRHAKSVSGVGQIVGQRSSIDCQARHDVVLVFDKSARIHLADKSPQSIQFQA